MEPIVLKCPGCGGELEFERNMEFGFCKYCGNKVMIPKQAPTQVVNIVSDSSKFFLLIYQKGEQTQHAIKDEVTLKIDYRNNSAYGDPNPLGIEVSSNGVAIPVKSRLPTSVGTGRIQISGIGSSLSLTKDQKVHININGEPMNTDFTRIFYGDMVSVGSLIIRIQPIPTD